MFCFLFASFLKKQIVGGCGRWEREGEEERVRGERKMGGFGHFIKEKYFLSLSCFLKKNNNNNNQFLPILLISKD